MLIVVELFELEKLRESEDGVERCAQFVTHARQEFALGLVRGLCRGSGGLEIAERRFQVCGAFGNQRERVGAAAQQQTDDGRDDQRSEESEAEHDPGFTACESEPVSGRRLCVMSSHWSAPTSMIRRST